MNLEMTLGFIVGVLVAIVAVVVLMRQIHDDSSLRTKYDERQLAARGRAFSVAWWVLVVLIVGVVLLEVLEIRLLDPMIELVFALFISCAVQVGLSVMSDAYFGLNETKRTKILIVFGAFGLVELAMGVNTFMEEGGLNLPSALYFSASLLFLVIFVTLIVKRVLDAREEE